MIRRSARPAGDAPLFSFVVVADTHVNESETASSSPFAANRLANARSRFVFQSIARMRPRPRFVIHLGDIVHPVPGLPSFDEAVARFKEIASVLDVPLHVVPGNHDVGDKRVEWMPADTVCAEYLAAYRRHFGPDWFSFDEGDARFVFLDSLLVNSGLEDEARQEAWLEDCLRDARGRRVFVSMHYPPYVHRPDERPSYDNVDEPGRGRLLALLGQPQVEAVFAGHVHNFWYDRIGSADFYMLPSTAFLRHDFTEFYRVAPRDEYGRGDVDKFGYFLVDVFRDGHVAYPIRTMGATAEAGPGPAAAPRLLLASPRTSSFTAVGVEQRQPWTESLQIGATGGVQEFGRKWARNDYPLLAMLEMGVRLSKVPDIDLEEPDSRARMGLLARMDHRFVVTSLGRPRTTLSRDELAAAGVEAFEVNATVGQLEARREAFARFRRDTGVRLYFSKIRGQDDARFDGRHFSHFVKAGHSIDGACAVADWLAGAVRDGVLDGITVRVEPDEDLVATARRMAGLADATGARILASLKLSGPGIAQAREADDENALNAALAAILSRATPGVCYLFDTFVDVDRGYYPRNGFVDRRFEPRPAARVLTAVCASLSSCARVALLDDEREPGLALAFSADDRRCELWCAPGDRLRRRLQALSPDDPVIDLQGCRALSAAELGQWLDGPGDAASAARRLVLIGA